MLRNRNTGLHVSGFCYKTGVLLIFTCWIQKCSQFLPIAYQFYSINFEIVAWKSLIKRTQERRFKCHRVAFRTTVRLYKNNKSLALQPRRAKTDWSACCQKAVQWALWLAKSLSLNLNFSFLNRISLLLISSSYPIVLTRLGGPHSRPYTFRKKIPGFSRESNPGPLGWQLDVLTTIPKMYLN